ncbi:hypothetical protein OV450_8237 [Actinobacteria bacterium OV450]|nr:hypothetical protein OV450_8237 [Actinobacteria bacterium OV450]
MNASQSFHRANLPTDVRVPAGERLADQDDYERYFEIVRCQLNLLEWTRTCLSVQDQVLADLPHTELGPSEQDQLRSGLALLNRGALLAWAEFGQGSSSATDTSDVPQKALDRWKHGHQLFHLVLVQMCTALDDALDSCRTGAWNRLTRLVDDLAVLFDAATATMAYAAAFPPDAYRNEVRPTMEPPYLPAGFSGNLNAEHQAMARLLHELRRAFTAVRAAPEGSLVPPLLDEAWKRLRAAQRRNWDNHVRICSNFVPDGASLLESHLAASAPQPPGTETGEGSRQRTRPEGGRHP